MFFSIVCRTAYAVRTGACLFSPLLLAEGPARVRCIRCSCAHRPGHTRSERAYREQTPIAHTQPRLAPPCALRSSCQAVVEPRPALRRAEERHALLFAEGRRAALRNKRRVLQGALLAREPRLRLPLRLPRTALARAVRCALLRWGASVQAPRPPPKTTARPGGGALSF